MICANCQQDNVEEANYCKYCGTLYPHKQAYLNEIETAIETNTSRKKLIVILMIVVSILYILTELF